MPFSPGAAEAAPAFLRLSAPPREPFPLTYLREPTEVTENRPRSGEPRSPNSGVEIFVPGRQDCSPSEIPFTGAPISFVGTAPLLFCGCRSSISFANRDSPRNGDFDDVECDQTASHILRSAISRR